MTETTRRIRLRRVIAGTDMLICTESFAWREHPDAKLETFIAGRDRVSAGIRLDQPMHPVLRDAPEKFRPADRLDTATRRIHEQLLTRTRQVGPARRSRPTRASWLPDPSPSDWRL